VKKSSSTRFSRFTHRAFQIGILLKGLDGLLELAGGGALLLTSQQAIRDAVAWLTRKELLEDPGDFVANHLSHLAVHLSIGTQHFAAAYLIVHGVVKLGLVIGLLRDVRGSYPAALAVLTAFIAYQCYRLAHQPSASLLLLTVIDVAVVLLIAREWRLRRQPDDPSLMDQQSSR
jgi:uncharacterized membrane protein